MYFYSTYSKIKIINNVYRFSDLMAANVYGDLYFLMCL